MPIVFYCPELIDYYTFIPVQKYLKQVQIVSKDPQVRMHMKVNDIVPKRVSLFPKAVIMCRHATHKFPCKAILRVGMRHGAYHFKKMTKAVNYNQFDIYFFTSHRDLRAAEEIGVTVGKNIGFPRLDPAFDGTLNQDVLHSLVASLGLVKQKPTLLFTSTWNESGMSAIDKWYNKLHLLSTDYNVLVTLHPWTQDRYRSIIRSTGNVHLIEDSNLLPYIMISDVCIGDTSSVLAECAALKKPIVRFTTDAAPRSLSEIEELLSWVSVSVQDMDELQNTLPALLQANPAAFPKRDQAVNIMFDDLDGKAGYRAAQEIIRLLPELKP